jgi:hypothetical protein
MYLVHKRTQNSINNFLIHYSRVIMHKAVKRIVPLDILQGDELHSLINQYKYDDVFSSSSCSNSNTSDPVHPLTLSPQVLVKSGERLLTPSPAAKCCSVSSWSSWITWKSVSLLVFGALVMFMLVRNWRIGRKLGFSYAVAAAVPPLRLLIAPLVGISADNMLCEIEAFNLGIHPVQVIKNVSPEISLASTVPPPPPPAPAPQKQKSRSELIDHYLHQAQLQQNEHTPTISAISDSVQRKNEASVQRRDSPSDSARSPPRVRFSDQLGHDADLRPRPVPDVSPNDTGVRAVKTPPSASDTAGKRTASE